MTNTIEIIPLARKKAQKRSISEDSIRETVISPDQTVEGYGGRKVAHKKYFIQNKEYLLRVIYEEEDVGNKVITAYLTSQVGRYWMEVEDEN